MPDILIFLGFFWALFVGIFALALTQASKQAREREERMERDEERGGK